MTVKGGTNTYKWPKDKVHEKLDEMLKIMHSDEGKKIFSLPRILSMVGLYVQWPHYIYSTLYPGDIELKEKIEMIATIIEANLYDIGVNSPKANSAVVLFGLRAYHKRSDDQNNIKIESDNKHSGEININLNLPKEKDE